MVPHIYGVHVKPSLNTVESLPLVSAELLPESETRFFERMSGIPMTFCRDGYTKVTRLAAHIPGTKLSFKKISDRSSKAPEPPKPHAFIKLDTKILDACVGQYKFAADARFRLELT